MQWPSTEDAFMGQLCQFAREWGFSDTVSPETAGSANFDSSDPATRVRPEIISVERTSDGRPTAKRRIHVELHRYMPDRQAERTRVLSCEKGERIEHLSCREFPIAR